MVHSGVLYIYEQGPPNVVGAGVTYAPPHPLSIGLILAI